MPSSADIRRKAQGVSAVASDIDRESGKYKSTVSGIRAWWQGEGAEALKEGYGHIDVEIRNLIAKMRTLKERVNNLASAVQQAEAKKEAARLQDQASKNKLTVQRR